MVHMPGGTMVMSLNLSAQIRTTAREGRAHWHNYDDVENYESGRVCSDRRRECHAYAHRYAYRPGANKSPPTNKRPPDVRNHGRGSSLERNRRRLVRVYWWASVLLYSERLRNLLAEFE